MGPTQEEPGYPTGLPWLPWFLQFRPVPFRTLTPQALNLPVPTCPSKAQWAQLANGMGIIRTIPLREKSGENPNI